jgi:MATE family multidrug resistance protein
VTVLQSYLSALHRTQVVLWVTLAAVAVNIGGQLGADLRQLGLSRTGRARCGGGHAAGAGGLSLVFLALYAGLLPELKSVPPVSALLAAGLARDGQVWRLGLPIGLTGSGRRRAVPGLGPDDGLDRDSAAGRPWHRA